MKSAQVLSNPQNQLLTNYPFQVFRSALGLHIEKAHGVYIIAPELASYRLTVGRGIEIQYAAAAGVLAGGFNLHAVDIAAADELCFHLFHADVRAVMYGDGG